MFQTLTHEYQIALKTKNLPKKVALNYLLAQIKNKEIHLQRPLNDEEIITLIKKEIKTIDEALSFLERTQKTEQIQEEKAKKEVLAQYLPETFDEETTKKIINQSIAELQLNDLKTQRWILIKHLLSTYTSQIDPQLINQIITSML